MIKKENVFCKDCAYYSPYSFFGCPVNYTVRVDPVEGEIKDYKDHREVNKNFDCPEFKKKVVIEKELGFWKKFKEFFSFK